ncbi:microtubule-associated tumor suppressor 1 homolog isoform X3 [Thunnus maccoyii]|uniref:microtubule-associated tumor suppressor 1 homolog isoform X3 n=1 Tax=Thunnus maccoyii TaxID=8240 RepID=UPI001C4A9002|nr:microtubule-associated tumor suppressor 1 homolog isoform X3 [Thunnus maccoyii]
MSVSKPSDIFSVGGKSGSSMTLPLHSAGDHNGNAFSISSSSSSSSSSSCLGELSPESLRSLSSLSGGRTDSPQDYDMLEVTLLTTVMTKTDEMTDIVISKWSQEEENKQDGNDDVSVGKMQTVTELSESNDNSTSVYLDANSSEYHQDTWNDNDNLTLALSLTTHGGSRGNNHDLSSGSSNGRRRGSLTPDSDATEIPEDDDEEEALFLSVSSDVDVRRTGMILTSSSSQSSEGPLNPGDSAMTTELQTEGAVAASVADDKRSEQVLEVAEVACPLDSPGKSQTEPSASEDLSEPTQISPSTHSSTNPVQDAKEVTIPPPEEAERYAVSSKPANSNTSQPARAAKTKPTAVTSAAPKTAASTAIKTSSLEAKRVSKLDLKNVKAKVGSRSTSSPPKPHGQQNKPAPANGKKAVPRKEEVLSNDGGKRQRSSPVKVAVVLKPIRGRSCNLKTSHKTAANDSAQPEKKSVTVSRTLSTSTSSLGSEVAEEGPQDTPRKAVQEVPDTVENKHPSEAAGEESVEDQREGTGKALPTESAVEKTRTPSRKVSSKLGPNARQQARGTRADKGPSEPAPPPGSGTGPPGQGSSGPRQAQTDVSKLGEGGQSTGGGSPTRVRQSLSQSQGIPKPRTTTERASALAAPGPATSNSKSTANQQPPSGSAGRPAAPSASKLPVKGLPTSLSSSSLGSNENNGATSKAPPSSLGAPAPTGTKPDERPSRITLPAGSQSAAKLTSSSATAPPSTSTPGDAVSANSNGVTAAPKPPAMRSRALSLQARTTATGLKAPSVTSHITAKTAAANQTAAKTTSAANQGLIKQASQYPLQRSGSARLSRLNNSVDKNKPREAPARSTNCNSSSQLSAPAGGNNQNQQQPPPDLVPDVVNANAPATSVLPVPAVDTANNGAGTTGASGLGFKARTGSRSSPKTASRLQSASKPGVVGAVVADGTLTAKQNQSKEQAEKKNQAINQLRKLLVQGNKRVEALATVIQHLFTEREETLKQKKELSLELANLRDELVESSQSCERLQKEKEEVRVSLEEALKRLEEQHKEELVQLEDRLRSFYQTEWDKVHQTYQEEADKCRMLMEQQVEELRSRQELERKNQEVSHSQKMESLKQQYETSIQELKRIQQTDLENLEKTLKETETSLSEKISDLSAEKEDLNEKLKAEEERRKRILSDKNLKDSHTVYLEQELESLKVVLEIKNNQLHQKEKKIMEMDKLAETNVKLEECLKKVQQENEDYKARMDKHAALSKQLSSEQAKLQQTLQKESKVNKRLSMENEELLWKLHNGDLLASPRRLSPTSPFSSPRNSASFPTTAPLSPR